MNFKGKYLTEILVENRLFFEEFVPKFSVAQMSSNFLPKFFGLK